MTHHNREDLVVRPFLGSRVADRPAIEEGSNEDRVTSTRTHDQGVPVPPSGRTPASQAAWLRARRGRLEIGPAPYTPPQSNEIVVRNRAVAINPVDWMALSIGDLFYPWLKYPTVLGSDVAGEVVAVGRAVSRFKLGDRVLGHAVGTQKLRNNPAEGAFQNYTVLLEHMVSPIPETLRYEHAAVLPLGLSTAACGLFQKNHLALQYPSADAKPTGKTLLVWGGSTSVGSNAIQLAVAAGYAVIATASPKNFAYARALGANLVFDYHSQTVVADIIRAFEGRTIAGALAVGVGSARPCLDIVHACKGDKFVSMATPSVSFDRLPGGFRRTFRLVPILAHMIASTSAMMIKARRRKIGMKFIWGSALVDNEVSRIIYGDFLPQALADRRYVPAPDPLIVGHELTDISCALETQKRGVSAKKIVVKLGEALKKA
jgi:NADPH:quinone reductase-like Zn-dependent oxidoreductase